MFLWFLFSFLSRKRIGTLIPSRSVVRTLTMYWFWGAIVLFTGMTVYTGLQTYQLSQYWGTAIHRRVHEWQTQTTISLEETNIVNQGLDGLLDELDQTLNLPETLYAYSTVELTFNREGMIESLYMPIIGENEEGIFESYLISSTDELNQLTVIRNNPNAAYETDENWLLSPLVDTLEEIPIDQIMNEWPDEESFGIYYAGYRTWGYNADGIHYIEETGPVPLEYADDEIIGYTVSFFVPGETDVFTPLRFIDRSLNFPAETQALEQEREVTLGYQTDEHGQDVFYKSEEIGYRLTVIDAATGSRWYGLDQTSDGGLTWESVNSDSFDGLAGVSSGIVFFDNYLGFFVLSRMSQTEVILYRTHNGGKDVAPVDLPAHATSSDNDKVIQPTQKIELPYEENGSLYVRVYSDASSEQFHDTYNLYESEDDGITWELVEENINFDG